jgi:membrane protein
VTVPPIVRELARRWSEHELIGRAGQLAYAFLFSLFPMLFCLTAILAYLPLQSAVDALLIDLGRVIPEQAMWIIDDHLRGLVGQTRPSFLTVGFAFAIYSGSRGVRALISALNLANGVRDSRPWWRVELLAMGFTLGTTLLLIVAFAAVLAGSDLGLWLSERIGISEVWAFLWSWLRWPTSASIVMLAAALAYRVLPDVHGPLRILTPGSLLGTLCWLVSSWGFAQYVTHFGKYNVTYGSIGGVIILLSWFYLSALILLLGGELNAALAKQA